MSRSSQSNLAQAVRPKLSRSHGYVMAAVASRHSTNSAHLSSKAMTSSPRSNRSSVQNSDSHNREGSSGAEVKQDTSIPTIKQPDSADDKDNTGPQTNAPLAPPPKPNQAGDDGSTSHLSKEPNPFENAFSNPADTPGKTQLPGVTSLTSPAPLLPGNTPGWPGSLRSGPLSPAMLTGPTGSNDYFNSDHHFAGSFPTPNESSLRTGLTPGGGGSMFPQPSPNSQALFHQLQSGGATPGTLDFHRTAMTARAQSHSKSINTSQTPSSGNTSAAAAAATSQAQPNHNIQPDLDVKPPAANANTARSDNTQDPFGSHQTNDAANGLFMLAQAGGQQRRSQGYPMPSQAQQAYPQGGGGGGGKDDPNGNGSTDGGDGQFSDDGARPQPKNTRGKKATAAAGKNGSTGKRKTEDTAKGHSSKKQRASISSAMSDGGDDDLMGMNDDMIGDRKMTDEEKRKNFLERNRVAALKCRQRKKQWLANLQQKVEIFSSENDALAATVTQLREEIVGLKTLLLAHKDCPVSQAQGISGMAMQQITGDTGPHYANPYGMAMGQGMPPGQGQMAQGQMQRR